MNFANRFINSGVERIDFSEWEEEKQIRIDREGEKTMIIFELDWKEAWMYKKNGMLNYWIKVKVL